MDQEFVQFHLVSNEKKILSAVKLPRQAQNGGMNEELLFSGVRFMTCIIMKNSSYSQISI